MEGFDLRTITLTNLFLCVLLGIGSLVFARVHDAFHSFRRLGLGYFLLALAFILIGLREHTSNFLSIIIANTLIFIGLSILIIGILEFLQRPYKIFQSITLFLTLLLINTFIYFTYFDNNTNARIMIISALINGHCFFIYYEIIKYQEKMYKMFTSFLGYAFLFCGVVFLIRVYLTSSAPKLLNYMDGGIVHAASLMAFQLVVITSCFTLSWSASQKLAHKLEVQASIDALTKLYNRRAMEDFSYKEILRAQRENTPISIILMDIDLFKQVNDNYGHQAGDKVLQEFSLRLKNSLRQYDILSRYGGEEFMLLLPNTDSQIALTIAEKLRLTIAQPVFEIKVSPPLSVTASFGVASIQDDNINWQQLVSFADNALYQAKNNGRDQVQLHCAEVHPLNTNSTQTS